MQLNNVHFKRIVSVLTIVLAIGGFGAAHAIEAPDAVVALWFPPLGKDLSNFPKDSIEHAIWLIQRGEVNLAEGILERVKAKNSLGVAGLLVWKHLDRMRDTTVDVVPEHVADSLINSGLGLRFEEDIAAALKEPSSGKDAAANSAGASLGSLLWTCLHFQPDYVIGTMLFENYGRSKEGTPWIIIEATSNCSETPRKTVELGGADLMPNFASYLKGIVDAALIPPEQVSSRARAFEELARTAAGRDDVCAEGLFLMMQGDVLAAPGASPLMLGIRRDWARALKDVAPESKQGFQKLLSGDFDMANRVYEKAQAQFGRCHDGAYAHWISVRQAYLAYRNGDSHAAALYEAAAQQAKVHGDSLIARLAQATGGLLSGSNAAVREAVNDSVTAGDFGAAMTIRHVAEIVADRLIEERNEPDRAVALTMSTADIFRDARLPGAAWELYYATANIFDRNGRVGTQIYFLAEAIKSASEFTACRSAVSKQGDCRGVSEFLTTIAATVAHAWDRALAEMGSREPNEGPWEKLRKTSRSNAKTAIEAWAPGRDGQPTTDRDGYFKKIDKELERLSNVVSAGMSEMEILLKASSIAHLASQTAMNCQEKVAAQEKIKHLTDDPALQQNLLAVRAIARCDPQVAAELKQSVRKIDPIGPLLAATEPNEGESPWELQQRQQQTIQSMVGAFITAFRLGEYALLADWIKKFSDIPASFADHAFASSFSLWYQASIANKKGNYSESRAILGGLLEHLKIVQNPTERLQVLSALAETEIRAGDSRKSFAAYLQWQQDVSSQRQTRNGVRPATPESAELTRLERRVALGEGISAQDDARIRALIQRVPIQDATSAPMVTVDSIEKSVPLDSSLVVYFMSPGLAAAWVREPGKELTLVKLTEDIDSLIEDINAFSHNVQSSGPSWRDDGARLYAKLIAPLGPLTGERIVIVPSLMMERLPFDALGRKDGTKLIEEKSIVVLPSLLSGYAHRIANHAQADPLIIGVNGEGLTRAVDEANAVAKLLGTKALTGPAARLESVGRRLETAPIIHLSTHALLDIDNPFESRIELGDPSQPIKGWWLFSQPINARLVTLSACETARGNLGRGEGFPSGLNTSPSLADTFHIAGVQYVVGTMWKVDDNYALPLMTRFYQELKTANEDPTVALSSAKRALIQDGQANAAQLAGFQVSVRSLTDLETGQ